MADADTLTDIIELIVGMVDAAPGADILAELETAVDAGASIEDLAIAIAANPAWSGDTGLFPDYLPDAIFASQWITQLLGAAVDADTLAEAIDEMTTLLTGGTGRGEAMYATIVALAASTDPDLADASATLANKTTVAEYYSITVAQSSTDLDDLLGVVAGIDETDASAEAAADAIDDAIAAVAPLVSLISDLDDANAAKTAFLAATDIDANPLTPTTEAGIEAARDTAENSVAGDANVDASYDGATAALKVSLLATAAILDAGDLAVLQTPATAADVATAAVAGLDSAVNTFEAAVVASDAAIAASLAADAAADGALANYNTLNLAAVTLEANGTVTGLIIISGTSLVLAAGITETTDPGVTALLAAAQAREAADAAELLAIGAANTALEVVENLDQTTARTTELTAIAAIMDFVTPDVTGEPTDAEIASEQSILDAGEAQLLADIGAIVFTTDEAATEALIETILDAYTTAGHITQAQNDTIEAAFDTAVAVDANQTDTDTAIAAAVAVVPANSISNDLTTAKGLYDGTGTAYTGGMTVATALALAPLADTQKNKQDLVDAEVLAQAAFAVNLAAEQAMGALQTSIAALDADIAAANAAFGDAGFEVPTVLDSALKAASVDDDVFILGAIDSTILSFGAGGDDTLFVGADYVLNAGDVDDDGDDSVLEIFFDGSDVIIETSVFGSNAAAQEIITVTLTGVSTDDLAFDGGFLTLV